MRRDILELDTSIANEIREGLSLQEMESVRLMLSGGSVIDWQRLAFENLEQVDAFLARQLLDMSDPDHVYIGPGSRRLLSRALAPRGERRRK